MDRVRAQWVLCGFPVLCTRAGVDIWGQWLWFEEEKGLEPGRGRKPGVWLGVPLSPRPGGSDPYGQLEAVCTLETDLGGRSHGTWGLTGQGRWRGRQRKEEQSGVLGGDGEVHLGPPRRDGQ